MSYDRIKSGYNKNKKKVSQSIEKDQEELIEYKADC